MQHVISSFITKEQYPLVIEPEDGVFTLDGFKEWLQSEKAHLQHLLLEKGALLFRNFPITNAAEFESVIETLNFGKFINYIGGDSPRTKITKGVYTSTEAPPHFKLPLHNELSFVNHFPKHIYFFCETPPIAGGETILADARKVYTAMDPEIRERFEEKGLKYVSCYYHKSWLMDSINRFQKSHKTWFDVFETREKEEVERLCRENAFDYQWNRNDWIKISQTRPATHVHPETGEKVWFNQAHLFDFNPKFLGFWKYLAVQALYCRSHMKLHEVFFADSSPIPRKDLYRILDVLDANTVYFPWQKGDLLVLDNVLAMHGRAIFSGKRRILTAMTG